MPSISSGWQSDSASVLMKNFTRTRRFPSRAFLFSRAFTSLFGQKNVQPRQSKYTLHGFRPKSLTRRVASVEEIQLLKINESTGGTWQLSPLDVPLGLVLDNGKPNTQLVTGWEPAAQDYDHAIQETWVRGGTPVPKNSFGSFN